MSLAMVLSPVSAQASAKPWLASALVGVAVLMLTVLSVAAVESYIVSPANALNTIQTAMGGLAL